MLKEIFYAFLASYGFGIIFQIRGKNLFFSSLVGGLGWGAHMFSMKLGASLPLSYFIASLVISSLSEFLARLLKTPSTSMLISGLIPLVPGGGLYYTIYYTLEKNMEKAIIKGAETFLLAGALSFGIVVITSIIKIKTTGQKNRYYQSKNKNAKKKR